MSGAELIEWAIQACERAGVPPNDAHILQVIRDTPNIETAEKRQAATPEGTPDEGARFAADDAAKERAFRDRTRNE